MSETVKTVAFLIVGAALFALAYSAGPGAVEPDRYSDEGTLFFPEFTQWDQATSLEVLEFDEASSQMRAFKVENTGSDWLIPSHDNYPADAAQQMAKAATLVIGLQKLAIRSDRQSDHESFAVVDPSQGETKGTGRLVKFSDNASNVLASLIIGNAVEGKPTQRYVRNPSNNRTYIAELNVQLSTRFADWIETDLLQLSAANITGVTLDYYSVNESTGRIVPGDKLQANKEDNAWAVAGLADDTEVDQTPLTTLTSTLDNLKIVGVRAKPASISARLAIQGDVALDPMTRLELQSKGFFVDPQSRKIISNEGDMLVHTSQGIEYTLRFGEVIFGDADSVSSSDSDKSPGDAAGTPESSTPDSQGQANRYLMVTAALKPDLLPKPAGLPLTQAQLTQRSKARQQIDQLAAAVQAFKTATEKFPESFEELMSHTPPLLDELAEDPWGNSFHYQVNDDGFQIISYGEDGNVSGDGVNEDISSATLAREEEIAQVARLHREYEDKLEAARKEQKSLQQRFAPWYYVIDDASYQKLHLQRAQIVKPKTEDG